METKARYILMGLFVLITIGAGFGFVYWLNNVGSLKERALYRVSFGGPVAGLHVGSPVVFNGIRVGEVSDLQLRQDNPQGVMATISVDPATPLRTDTKVAIDVLGLMGSAALSLKGGLPDAPRLASTATNPPVLVADRQAGQDVMQVARDLLEQLHEVVATNSDSLHNIFENLSSFAGALGRNSARVDTILIGLEHMAGASSASPAPKTYDLTAPNDFPAIKVSVRSQLAIVEPSVPVVFDTQRLLKRTDANEISLFADAQWSDSLPKLVQAKIIESFENADRSWPVARASDGLGADYQLLIELRQFQISMVPEPVATVEFVAKIASGKGRILNSRIFKATVLCKSAEPPAAASALSEAFDKAARELVPWVAQTL